MLAVGQLEDGVFEANKFRPGFLQGMTCPWDVVLKKDWQLNC